MDIKILQLIDGVKQAKGLTVVIDVFRAFSTACYIFANGADKIIPVGDIEVARKLKAENPHFLLVGERKGRKPDDFDYGNSPTQIENVDFTGKTVIQTTSAGTQGIVNAVNAEEIITGSFVNARAIATYVGKRNPKEVSLVAMGSSGVRITEEDTLCAEFIKNELEGKPNDFSRIVRHLRSCKSAQKFFDPLKDWAPERDFDLCLSLNKFNFVLKVGFYSKNQLSLSKVEV